MSYRIRYTDEAIEDFDRLYDYLITYDLDLAERALAKIRDSIKLLEQFPFSCRKSSEDSPLLRELLVPFGASGYVVLFRIDGSDTVSVAAIRHQREEDYH
jgi:plasmid stabilization system protein ParE